MALLNSLEFTPQMPIGKFQAIRDGWPVLTPKAQGGRFHLRVQSVDATQAANRSAGVSKSSVFLGLSLSSLATWFSFACE